MLRFGQVFKGKDSPLTLDWNRVRVFDREVGQMFVNLAKTSREAQVRANELFIIILFNNVMCLQEVFYMTDTAFVRQIMMSVFEIF